MSGEAAQATSTPGSGRAMTTEQREHREQLDRRIRYSGVRGALDRAMVCALLLLPLLAPIYVDRADTLVVATLAAVAVPSLLGCLLRLTTVYRLPASGLRRPWLVPVVLALLAVALVCWPLLLDAVWHDWLLHRSSVDVLSLVLAVVMVTAGGAVSLAQSDRRSLEPLNQPSGFKRAMLPTAHERHAGFQGTAIACSGGGIRAAAFSLGGLQRLRLRGDDGTSLYDGSYRVYGVSGGGYIATALHLARKHSDGDPDDLFGPGSPEEDWLRRKSKFLLPSGALSTGVLSLVYGIAVNLTMVGIALVLAARYVGWVHVRLQSFCDPPALRSSATCLGNGEPATWQLPGGPWTAWGVLVLALGWFALTKTASKYAPAGRLRGTRFTRALLAAGAVVALVLGLTPWFVVHLNNAALDNQPSEVVARALSAARLATPNGCRARAQADFVASSEIAWERTPRPLRASSIPVHYGTCGSTWTDDVLAFTRDGRVTVPPGRLGLCDPALGATPTYCDEQRPDNAGGLSPVQTVSAWLAALAALSAGFRGVVKGLRGATSSSSRAGRLVMRLRSVVVPWTAAVALGLVAFVVVLVQVRDTLLHPANLEHSAVLLGVLGVVAVLRLSSDAFSSSLHPFYRERLSETFLVKREDDDAVALDYGDPTHVFTSFADSGPELTICCAANIEDRDYIPAERGCASFRFDTGVVGDAALPAGRIGMSDARLPVGAAADAEAFSATSDPQGADTTLAAAMATSGAAFSPLVGRLNHKVRPYRVLLALANARLGVWLPNPYCVRPDAKVTGQRSRPLRWAWTRIWRPGPSRILKEAFGQLSVYDEKLYITDGGHYDNTGIVEALRDKPATLIVFDASGDTRDSLEAMSEAIVTARMDLGLVVRPADGSIDAIRGHTDADGHYVRPEQGWLHFEVAAVNHPTVVRCDLFLVKNVLPQVAAVEVEAYAGQHPDFPHTPTTNQFYGEYDFEAYRRLGNVNTRDMVESRAFRYRDTELGGVTG
jgi:hypothetical protein